MFRLDRRCSTTTTARRFAKTARWNRFRFRLKRKARFEKAGNLWVSASNGSWGKLYRLNRQGQVQAEYAMVAGLEDLTVDDDGRLWGLSESGTPIHGLADKFPYQIDTAKLR